jgi:DNA primase
MVHDSVALLGVAIKPEAIAKLLTCGYKRAIIFLDGDNPQVKMAARAIAKRLFFLDVSIIETGRDPKEYSLEELKEMLK